MGVLSDRTVVVVGSGFGGLSVACYLADAGADVRVLERNEQLGGRASRLWADGYRFDMGPSWYLMPDVFERFFGHFDCQPADYYELTHLDPHYRLFFKDNAGARPTTDAPGLFPDADGDRIDVTPDREQVKQVFAAYEDGADDALDRYLVKSRHNYEVGMEHFVYEDRSRLRDFIDWDVAKNARGLSLLGSMQDHVAGYFEHPKLRQIMQYTLVFLGGAPNTTPALYNLMSHVDFNLGVYYPEGGIGGVVDGMVELATDLGVTFHTNAPVTAIEGERGDFTVTVGPPDEDTAVEPPVDVPAVTAGHHDAATGDGATAADGATARSFAADLVVSDADYAHTEQELLAPADRQYDADYWDSRTYAPSAFLLYLGVEGDVDPLAHHTLVLPGDWDDHFATIFDDPAWPDDPAYYVCVPSQTDDDVAPDGHSALFILVPIAPGLGAPDERRDSFRADVLADLAEHTGVDLRDRITFERTFTVEDFAGRYNAYAGSALGLAHTLRQTAFLRPSHRSDALDGLYYTGSYTTPGIGVPMCLISGHHTADAVRDDER
jgi:phytoene desaturase